MWLGAGKTPGPTEIDKADLPSPKFARAYTRYFSETNDMDSLVEAPQSHPREDRGELSYEAVHADRETFIQPRVDRGTVVLTEDQVHQLLALPPTEQKAAADRLMGTIIRRTYNNLP
jgi:hypothetical protein